MTRKLLPYEYDLIDTLGVSKEEYLEFLALQEQYNDPKAGTNLDIRNAEVVAIVLAVVGVIFQVVSVLLAPKPTAVAQAAAGQTQTREQRFSPRFGFNTTQELANYGDVVPIVYTDTVENPAGGVRVAGSLLWSAVSSFGSNQFLRMMVLLSGGNLSDIDASKTAFGQTPLSNLLSQNYWMYFKRNSSGRLSYGDEVNGLYGTDPSLYADVVGYPYHVKGGQVIAPHSEGYSQAYSPTSANTFGGYSPVPLNVQTFLRNSVGDRYGINLGIYAYTNFGWNTTGNMVVPTGALLTVEIVSSAGFDSTGNFDLDIAASAADARQTISSFFDDAGIFKLGSARFRVTSIQGTSPSEGNLYVNLSCIYPGCAPTTPYTSTSIAPSTVYTQNSKALIRIEQAEYTTISKCNIINISLRCQQFMRISGRQTVYGSAQVPGHSLLTVSEKYSQSDNGIHNRAAMFMMRYRISGETSWRTARGFFIVSRSAEQDNYLSIIFEYDFDAQIWEFQFEPVVDPIAEVAWDPALRQPNGQVRFFYMQNSGDTFSIYPGDNTAISFTGFYADSNNGLPPLFQSPVGVNEWDWFNMDADTQMQTSFDRGPEFTITAVSEQQRESISGRYENLSLFGFNVFSGKNLQDMRALSVFVTRGKWVRRLNITSAPGTHAAEPDGPSNYAPDIFLDTIYDSTDGIGKYANIDGIDINQLYTTKLFCYKNKLFMDCIIADRRSWREFWAEAAAYSLLEFARIGGRETLVPAVPYDPTTGAITTAINVSALFNQGNILEDSYKEEYIDYGANVQDLIATIIYRGLDSEGIFAVNKSVTVQRSDVIEADAIFETFDLSAYVTTEAQAVLFAKLLCNTRRYVRSAIEFKTYPTTTPISPGAYIYVDIGFNAWDSTYTGTVGPGGVLNFPLNTSVSPGNYYLFLYKSGSGVIITPAYIGSNNTASSLADKEGWLFVFGQQKNTKRIYRVSEVQMDEEGLVTIRGTIFPVTSSGSALISDFADQNFEIRR